MLIHWTEEFFTQSQNHRMVGVGRDLCGSSSPTPLPKQGHLEQAILPITVFLFKLFFFFFSPLSRKLKKYFGISSVQQTKIMAVQILPTLNLEIEIMS